MIFVKDKFIWNIKKEPFGSFLYFIILISNPRQTSFSFAFLVFRIFLILISDLHQKFLLKKDYLNKPISNFIIKSISRREKILENHFKELNFVNEEEIECSYILSTILVNGEATGMIVIISEDEKLSEVEMQLASIVSSFMTKYLEQ